MTEYQCSAIDDNGKTYELLTCACPIFSHANRQFMAFVRDEGGEPDNLVCISFNAIEVEE